MLRTNNVFSDGSKALWQSRKTKAAADAIHTTTHKPPLRIPDRRP